MLPGQGQHESDRRSAQSSASAGAGKGGGNDCIALPELISLALQGRIASAVAVVPSISIDVGEGYNPEQIMDVIGDIASYHVMICLLTEARRTHAALYSPTGLPVLDNHGGQRPVPLAFAVKTIVWNANQFIAVQRLYGIGRDLTAGEQALIDQYEGIRDHAQRFEAEWRTLYGDSFPAILAETVAKSRLWTRYIRMQIDKATKSGGRNASLFKFQQSDPLNYFWLSCRMAIAWLGFPATRKRTLENAFNTSRLTEALRAIDQARRSDCTAELCRRKPLRHAVFILPAARAGSQRLLCWRPAECRLADDAKGSRSEDRTGHRCEPGPRSSAYRLRGS